MAKEGDPKFDSERGEMTSWGKDVIEGEVMGRGVLRVGFVVVWFQSILFEAFLGQMTGYELTG